MNFPEYVIPIWFVLSVLLYVLSGVILGLWLWRKRYVKLSSAFAGLPGYLEAAYIKYCKENNRPYKLLIAMRVIFTINVIFAGISFIPFVISGKG